MKDCAPTNIADEKSRGGVKNLEFLYKMLREKNIKQNEFAKMIHVSEPTLINWKKRDSLRLSTLTYIASVMGMRFKIDLTKTTSKGHMITMTYIFVPERSNEGDITNYDKGNDDSKRDFLRNLFYGISYLANMEGVDLQEIANKNHPTNYIYSLWAIGRMSTNILFEICNTMRCKCEINYIEDTD